MKSQLRIDLRQLTTPSGDPLQFTQGQASFLASLVPRVAIFGGFGSGKTFPFVTKGVVLAHVHGKGYRGQLISPTYDMLQRVLIPTLRDDVMMKLGDPDNGRSLWDLSNYEPSKKMLTFPNGFELLFGSADNPSRTRGTNLAFIGVDEASMIDKFDQLYISAGSRLRRARPHPVTGVPMQQMFFATTPEGLDPMYNKFIVGPEKQEQRAQWKSTHQTLRISTYQNPGITQDFLDQMMLGIPDALIPAYLHGLHVDVGRGRCYYNFDHEQNVRKEAKYDPSKDLCMAWDFNADPMSCTIHQVQGEERHRSRQVLCTIDEVVLRNSNTPETCREIVRRYGSQGERHRRGIRIYGDASDAIGISNYDEIEDYLRGHFTGSKITRHVPKANPRHIRRLKSVNAMARNAAGDVRWWINPRCRWTIRDLMQQKMDPGGKSKDKRQEADDGTTLGHCSDTIDYIVDRLWPYQKPNWRNPEAKGSRLTQHIG